MGVILKIMEVTEYYQTLQNFLKRFQNLELQWAIQVFSLTKQQEIGKIIGLTREKQATQWTFRNFIGHCRIQVVLSIFLTKLARSPTKSTKIWGPIGTLQNIMRHCRICSGHSSFSRFSRPDVKELPLRGLFYWPKQGVIEVYTGNSRPYRTFGNFLQTCQFLGSQQE